MKAGRAQYIPTAANADSANKTSRPLRVRSGRAMGRHGEGGLFVCLLVVEWRNGARLAELLVMWRRATPPRPPCTRLGLALARHKPPRQNGRRGSGHFALMGPASAAGNSKRACDLSV